VLKLIGRGLWTVVKDYEWCTALPSHADGLVEWIIQMQVALTKAYAARVAPPAGNAAIATVIGTSKLYSVEDFGLPVADSVGTVEDFGLPVADSVGNALMEAKSTTASKPHPRIKGVGYPVKDSISHGIATDFSLLDAPKIRRSFFGPPTVSPKISTLSNNDVVATRRSTDNNNRRSIDHKNAALVKFLTRRAFHLAASTRAKYLMDDFLSRSMILPLREATAWHAGTVQQVASWEASAFGGRNEKDRTESLNALLAGRLDTSPFGVLEQLVAYDMCTGSILGSVALVMDDAAFCARGHGLSPWLSSVYVSYSARRKGIGHRLVEGIIQEATRRGFVEIFLYHFPDSRDERGHAGTRLTAMYERWGFEMTNLHKRLRSPEIRVMRRSLIA
jgi:GNAT superfamily N-acetyltransferase